MDGVPTERTTFPDGNWWEFRTVVTRGMRKAFRDAATRGVLRAVGRESNDGINLQDPEALQRAVAAHPEAWDLNAVDDAFLLGGTVAWSFGPPVCREAIDGLAESYVAPVLERMQVLYAEPTAEQRAAFFATSPSSLGATAPSPAP